MFLCQGALLDSVDLEINPPYAWDAEHHPEYCFLEERAEREPLQKEEVGGADGEEEGELEAEEEDVEGGVDARGRRGDGEEGGYSGA